MRAPMPRTAATTASRSAAARVRRTRATSAAARSWTCPRSRCTAGRPSRLSTLKPWKGRSRAALPVVPRRQWPRTMVLDIDTPHGPAKAHLHLVETPAAALVLGHGAGGGVGAPDLVTATEAARSLGISVALVEQPYRVAGLRSPAPAHQLDAAWTAVVERLLAA